tara:strand:+ start:319 stop:1983 length:1665 start_codon:yes stop_codon:yes gene_type:complete
MPFISASAISPYDSIRGGAAGGTTPLLLDLYPNALVAYDLRKLSSTYTGDCVKVRRASDNAEQDIGFVSGQIDISSLETFASGGVCHVTTFYDQSGNANNAIQTAAANQPVITDSSGNVTTVNSKPSVLWTVDESWLEFTSITPYSVFVAQKLSTVGGAYANFIIGGANNDYISSGSANASIGLQYLSVSAKASVKNGNNYRNSVLEEFVQAEPNFIQRDLNFNMLSLIHDNSTVLPTASTMSRRTTNTSLGQSTTRGHRAITLIYGTDQSANRAAIESNINSFYNMYWDGSQTGLLDDYPSAAAAYSLRALNSAYTGPLVRVRRSNNNEKDIFARYDGSLNTTDLLNFVGSGDGFVTTLYDQSGNGINANQSSASKQPIIASSGVISTLNGKPTMQFISSFVMDLNLTGYPFTSGGSATEKSIFAVAENNATANQNLYNIADTRDIYAITYNRSANNTYAFLGANYGTIGGNITGQNIISSLAISPSSETFNNTVDGVSSNLVRANFNDISIGSRGGSYPMDGNIQEMIMYESDQSSNRGNIETNINDYYNVY